MRIVITGANGMLGTDAVAYFAAAGHEVVRVDRIAGPDTTVLDITDPHATREFIGTIRPDVVLHCAANTNVDGCEREPDGAYKGNALGTWSIAVAAESVGATLVAISTDFVFDGSLRRAYTEFDAPNPLGHYGASKLAGERLAMQHCSRTYIVRTAWLYGIHGRNFPLTIAKRARETTSLSVVGDQHGSPTWTVDLVRRVDTILQTGLYGVYHATNSGEATWFDFAQFIVSRLGITGVIVEPITSDEYAVRFGSPTRRPLYSVLRAYSLELQGIEAMRPWTEALSQFLDRAVDAGLVG